MRDGKICLGGLCAQSFRWPQYQKQKVLEILPKFVCKPLLWMTLYHKARAAEADSPLPCIPVAGNAVYKYFLDVISYRHLQSSSGTLLMTVFSQLEKEQINYNFVSTRNFHYPLSFWKMFNSWTIFHGLCVYFMEYIPWKNRIRKHCIPWHRLRSRFPVIYIFF